jgi:hypothetical protein
VYYPFIPPRFAAPKEDRRGRLVPDEVAGHFRGHLERTLDQSRHTALLQAPPERSRRDIWWVSDVPEDLLAVVADIATAFIEQGHPWFERLADLPEAFRELEAEHDGLDKFYRAMHFAKHLRLETKALHYAEAFKLEARRIGYTDDGRPQPQRHGSRRRRSA